MHSGLWRVITRSIRDKVYLCKMDAERTISSSASATVVAVILEALSDSESSEESCGNETIDFLPGLHIDFKGFVAPGDQAKHLVAT